VGKPKLPDALLQEVRKKNQISELSKLFLSPTIIQLWVVDRIDDYGLIFPALVDTPKSL
jgi:hypothetical protein